MTNDTADNQTKLRAIILIYVSIYTVLNQESLSGAKGYKYMHDVTTRPKSQALFESIRAKILGGQHPAGQWLKQADLEKDYGATRSEVRSALSSLAERGIVEYVKNRGFRVFSRTEEEINEIAEMILALELAAAPQIAETATAEDIETLKKSAANFEEVMRTGRQADLRVANYGFHGAVIDICGNKLIAQTVKHMRECCASGPEVNYMTMDGLQKSNSEHYAIIEAIEARDGARLIEHFKEHSSFRR